MIPIVDTHCHLDLDAFDTDRCETLKRGLDAGVRAMILIGYNPERWVSTQRMCERWPFLIRAVGVHPNDATIWNDDVRNRLRAEIEESQPVAVGEIGLDFYRSAESKSEQIQAFEEQLEIAAEFQLPVIIHQRSAEAEVLEILERHRPSSGVMHCFTGDTNFASRCIDLGFHLGIGGVVTYPRSTAIREAVAAVPLESLVLETDAPFMAPQSRRGKRNEPALLTEVVEEVARAKDVSVEQVRNQTTRNAINLFGPSLHSAIHSELEF